jgi:hypothetical protein
MSSLKIPPRICKYYTDKINIYQSDAFIPLPAYITCPPPSMIIIAPYQTVNTPYGSIIQPIPQPMDTRLAYCGGCQSKIGGECPCK